MDEPRVVLKKLTPQDIKSIQDKLKKGKPEEENEEGDEPIPSTSQWQQPGKQEMKEKINTLVASVNKNLVSNRRVDQMLKNIYYNPSHSASFGSIEKLYQVVVKQFPQVNRDYIKGWLSIQPTYAAFKQVRGKLKRRKVLVRGIGHQYQADLLDVLQYYKSNMGYKYLLTVLDCFSRKAWAVPLKTKKGIEMVKAFQKVFQQLGPPRKMQTDQGSEFYNVHVQNLFRRLKIIHFSTKQNVKAQMVERFNRTIRDKIKKYTAANKNYHYINALPELLQSYNNSVHSSLKEYTPNQVNKFNENHVREILYGSYFQEKKQIPKFVIGDVVLIAQKKAPFDKTSPFMDTKKRYVITDVIHKFNPPMYKVQGEKDKIAVDRALYAEEMHKISTELE